MMQLHQDNEKFKARDTIVVAIGPEDPEDFNDFWEGQGFEFYGIPDEKHRVLKLYGQEFKPLKLGRMPAQILVDKEGIVRYVHYGQAMDDISEDQNIFDLIDKLYSVVS